MKEWKNGSSGTAPKQNVLLSMMDFWSSRSTSCDVLRTDCLSSCQPQHQPPQIFFSRRVQSSIDQIVNGLVAIYASLQRTGTCTVWGGGLFPDRTSIENHFGLVELVASLRNGWMVRGRLNNSQETKAKHSHLLIIFPFRIYSYINFLLQTITNMSGTCSSICRQWWAAQYLLSLCWSSCCSVFWVTTSYSNKHCNNNDGQGGEFLTWMKHAFYSHILSFLSLFFYQLLLYYSCYRRIRRYWSWNHLFLRGCLAKWPCWNHCQRPR